MPSLGSLLKNTPLFLEQQPWYAPLWVYQALGFLAIC